MGVEAGTDVQRFLDEQVLPSVREACNEFVATYAAKPELPPRHEAVQWLGAWFKSHSKATTLQRKEELLSDHLSRLEACSSMQDLYDAVCFAIKANIPGACAYIAIHRQEFVPSDEEVPLTNEELEALVANKQAKKGAPLEPSEEVKTVQIVESLDLLDYVAISREREWIADRVLMRGRWPSFRCLETGKPVHIENLLVEPNVLFFSGGPRPGDWPQPGSFYCLPLMGGGEKPTGILGVDTIAPGDPLQHHELKLIDSLWHKLEELSTRLEPLELRPIGRASKNADEHDGADGDR